MMTLRFMKQKSPINNPNLPTFKFIHYSSVWDEPSYSKPQPIPERQNICYNRKTTFAMNSLDIISKTTQNAQEEFERNNTTYYGHIPLIGPEE